MDDQTKDNDPMVIVYAVAVGFVIADLIFLVAVCLRALQ
jgi:hypothetical protein